MDDCLSSPSGESMAAIRSLIVSVEFFDANPMRLRCKYLAEMGKLADRPAI
jgi:hypothetical protein